MEDSPVQNTCHVIETDCLRTVFLVRDNKPSTAVCDIHNVTRAAVSAEYLIESALLVSFKVGSSIKVGSDEGGNNSRASGREVSVSTLG